MQKVTVFLIFFLYSTISFAQETFTLSSSDIGGQATKTEEFNGFGCTGQNQSPHLSWKNAPKETKSFAITVYDPNAPTESGWWHWVVFDIPSDINELVTGAGDIKQNLMPKEAIQSITNYGVAGYGGPCPPKNHGLHQYIVTLHALKTDKLGLDASTNPAVVGYYLWNNTIAKASLVFYYQR
ncbi:YbhB/YbcL family Raf kinase inhibitor-like protein [Bernardetia sp.]|uniref:YbhB/YbcL family Raf kinase inhibitor-like protein n=1 Tax=Bernardetia sp. TaxID=1937974 RepID=UPI0025BC1924|nr:YbhB/YbcL family Raf kinase inhibitor-like protein [Bernardetia sp.]